jgi:aryl-alcohol dehydrogenase-like predicted oxidoreductase
VERRTLGRAGFEVPVVGLGTYRVFHVHDDAGQARCEAVVDAAFEEGAVLFDSSPMYGEAEKVLAAALAERSERGLVATKVWARNRAVGEDQIERALGWFGRIDLYQVHNLLMAEEHLPLLHRLKEEGKVRAVGASHYLPSAFPELLALMDAHRIDAIQIPYHPTERRVEEEILPAAERLGVGVLVMSPLGQGRLLERAPAGEDLAPLAAFGVFSWAQALLKWIASDPRVTAVVPATSSPEHMRENAAAGRPPWFGPEERRYVAGLAARLH